MGLSQEAAESNIKELVVSIHTVVGIKQFNNNNTISSTWNIFQGIHEGDTV